MLYGRYQLTTMGEVDVDLQMCVYRIEERDSDSGLDL
jgi:hypothetical protein